MQRLYNNLELLVMDFEEYRNYLKIKAKVPKNQIAYYLGWITQFFAFCNKEPGQHFDAKAVLDFIDQLAHRCEDWQVAQAQKAIELYRYLQSKKSEQP